MDFGMLPEALREQRNLWSQHKFCPGSSQPATAVVSLPLWTPPPSSPVSSSDCFHVIHFCLSFSLCSDSCFPAPCSHLLARKTVKVEVFSLFKINPSWVPVGRIAKLSCYAPVLFSHSLRFVAAGISGKFSCQPLTNLC